MLYCGKDQVTDQKVGCVLVARAGHQGAGGRGSGHAPRPTRPPPSHEFPDAGDDSGKCAWPRLRCSALTLKNKLQLNLRHNLVIKNIKIFLGSY